MWGGVDAEGMERRGRKREKEKKKRIKERKWRKRENTDKASGVKKNQR